MKFNFRIAQLLSEAGGYMTQNSKSKTPQEAVESIKTLEKEITRISKELYNVSFDPQREKLEILMARKRVDDDLRNKVIEYINTINQWGDKITENGNPINKLDKIQNIFKLSNHPEHDYTKITPETKKTAWFSLVRPWFDIYSKYISHKALDKRTYSQAQTNISPRNEIFYFGEDGKPYVTTMAFDAEDMVHGGIFGATDRFFGEPQRIKAMRYDTSTPRPIPRNAKIEKLFGRPEVSKDEIKKMLNSKEAEKAFKQRLKDKEELKIMKIINGRPMNIKQWYDKKYSRLNVEKI